MDKKYNIFLLVILCLAAFFVLSQPKQNKETGADNQVNALPGPGRLVVTQQYDVNSLDPALASDPGSLRVIANIYEGLVRFKPGTVQVEPCLATGWEVSSDAKVWTFHLRHDVMFQDGTPLNAQAVEASVKRQTENQKKQTNYADFVYSLVQKIEVPDNYTIRFDLKYPFAPFINNLAVPMSAPVMGPVGGDSSNGGLTATSGTGPYIPVKKINGGIVLRANPHYWSTSPAIKEIIFLTVKDPAVASQMLLQRQSDLALDLTFDDAAQVRAQGFPVYSTTGLDICYLGFYTDRAPFDRTELRQAVARALDIKGAYAQLGLQQAQPASGQLPPGVLGSEWEQRPAYDPAVAKQLLHDAGEQQGLSFTLITYADPRPYTPGGGQALAEALARSAAQAGITIKVKVYPWSQFKEALQRREGDAFLYGWISDNGDPDNFLYTLLAPDQIAQGQNITRYSNSQLESILLNARKTTQVQTRRDLYGQAQEILAQDTPWVVLGYSLAYAATAPGITGFVLSPTGWQIFNGVKKMP